MRVVAATLTVAGVLVVAGLCHAQEQTGIPKEVLKELGYLVGTWKIEGKVGDTTFTAKSSTRWSRGKHCLIANWSGSLGDRPIHGTAVVGWDSQKRQIVDFGFIRGLGHRTIRWTPKSPTVWEGETTGFILGNEVKSKNRIEKRGPAEFTSTAKGSGGHPDQEYHFTKIPKAKRERKKKAKA